MTFPSPRKYSRRSLGHIGCSVTFEFNCKLRIIDNTIQIDLHNKYFIRKKKLSRDSNYNK